MDIQTIVELIILGVIAVAGIVAIVISLVRGELKKFIQEKMAEAEELYKDMQKPEKSQKKLEYVLEAVKEKYKLAGLFINIKKFVAKMIEFVNSMKTK